MLTTTPFNKKYECPHDSQMILYSVQIVWLQTTLLNHSAPPYPVVRIFFVNPTQHMMP